MITFTEIAGAGGGGRDHRHDLQAARARACRSTACRSSSGRCWSPSFMVIFAMPAVMLASTLLIMDRLVGTHFFNPAEGGDALLWQHLFWFFGHPEVYIIFLPALGMVSSIIADLRAAADVRLSGAGAVADRDRLPRRSACGCTTCSRPGCRSSAQSFFTAASMMIAIPTGVQIFCWIATLWGGRPGFTTPLLFVLGFFVIFVIGGLTGVMLASVPLDLQVHDTYFVVAHFHYVLIGGAVFPLFGGVLLLVPEVHRPDAERAPRPLELLAGLHRLQRRLLPDAHPRAAGHAAAGLHLPARDRLGGTESACDVGAR